MDSAAWRPQSRIDVKTLRDVARLTSVVGRIPPAQWRAPVDESVPSDGSVSLASGSVKAILNKVDWI